MMQLKKTVFITGALSVGTFSAFYFAVPVLFPVTYYPLSDKVGVQTEMASTTLALPKIIVTHIQTPEPLKAVYMSACYASAPSLRAKLVHLIETTELNAVMIDVKDYSGTIAYRSVVPKLVQEKVAGCRVADMQAFVATLHEKGIYVIARVTVFQDPLYTHAHPELAVKRKSDGGIWKDRKGLSFIDVSAKPYWEYVSALAQDAYAIGFDEINFDYIRFPSDGNMKDIAYPWTATTTKSVALEKFFAYLEEEVKPSGAVISADLFGMTTTNTDDLNIGQVLEPALRHFDYVAPMVYPSHYPPNFNGWANPNEHVYGVIKYSMDKAVARAKVASTTPLKLRPWLQDFDYGGDYGAVEVRAQIQATYDSGLTSWMLWDPNNRYTPAALLK
ncbi:MAG: putative glycoside hydrolase [Patescibacteria group bacterium]